MSNYKDVKYNFTGENITSIPTSAFSSGTFADARVAASNVSQHVSDFSDTNARNDLSVLAINHAINNTVTSKQWLYQLPNSFIDNFADDSGLDGETNVDRESEGGNYMASVYPAGPAGGIDANTKYLLHSNTTDGSTTFTDLSGNGITASHTGNGRHETSPPDSGHMFATSSSLIAQGGTSAIIIEDDSDLDFGSGNFTIDCWIYGPGTGYWISNYDGSNMGVSWYRSDGGLGPGGGNVNHRFGSTTGAIPFLFPGGATSTYGELSPPNHIESMYFPPCGGNNKRTQYEMGWGNQNHQAFVRNGGTFSYYINGILEGSDSVSGAIAGGQWYLFQNGTSTDTSTSGWMQEFRMSNTARWTANFQPPLIPYHAAVDNATGNFTSANQTALATISKGGIVVLYKNNSGTATINTDLVAAISANGGTNYETVTLVALGTTIGGYLMAGAQNVTISNTGTSMKYKISFANQSAGSKETRVHGVALLY